MVETAEGARRRELDSVGRFYKRRWQRWLIFVVEGARRVYPVGQQRAACKRLNIEHENFRGTKSGGAVSKVAVGGFEALRQTLPVRRRTLVSFGEPIALRMEAELERAADSAASADDRFEGSAQAQFLERLRSGDALAFSRLVEERYGDIYALLYRLTEDAEEARDLTQETFLQAFRNIAGFRGEADLRTWLYRIAVNQARNRWRWWKRRRRDKTVSLDAPIGDENGAPLSAGLANEDVADPEQQALARERERALLSALSTLSRPYREVIVLRDIEGLSYEEVAQALDMNIGTVKSRLSRGRDELRRRLEGSL
jgi:RNA polymerase sigma-70 factor (ECF subfamily)